MSGQKNDAIYAATVAFAVAKMRELGWMPPVNTSLVSHAATLRDAAIEQQARELLAAEVGCNADDLEAAFIQRDDALRAIARALARPAPTEEAVLAAAKRAAAANSGVSQEYGDLLWSYLDERAQAHWLKVARAALGVGQP